MENPDPSNFPCFFWDLARGQYFGERIGQGWNSESFAPNADSSSIDYRLGRVTPFVILKAAFWGCVGGGVGDFGEETSIHNRKRLFHPKGGCNTLMQSSIEFDFWARVGGWLWFLIRIEYRWMNVLCRFTATSWSFPFIVSCATYVLWRRDSQPPCQ